MHCIPGAVDGESCTLDSGKSDMYHHNDKIRGTVGCLFSVYIHCSTIMLELFEYTVADSL